MTKKTTIKTMKNVDKSIIIMGVSINGTQKDGVLKKLASQRKKLLHIATVNSEFLMEARKNEKFKKVLDLSELKIVDSWGVVWASQILNLGDLERFTGVELVREILKLANRRKEKVFLLGAGMGVAEKAARAMEASFPDVEYAWYEGAKTIKLERSEEASMTIAKINSFEPDYLLVAYGSPWQDIWIEENKEYLRSRVAVGVGGVLDEWAGVVKLCPDWIDKLGGKWLWRLITQPRIRMKRVWNVFKFAGLVWKQKLID